MERLPDDDLPAWESPDPFRQAYHRRDERGPSRADTGRVGWADRSPVSSLNTPPPRIGDPRWADHPDPRTTGGHRLPGSTGTTRTVWTIAALAAAGLVLAAGFYLTGDRSPAADRSTARGGSPTPAPTASAPPNPSGAPPWDPSRPPAGSVVTGPGCPSDGDGAYSALRPGVTALPDGWTGDGCTGRLDLIALPDEPGVDTIASWTFTVASGGAASCYVGVYVPPLAAKFGPASYRVEAGGAGGEQVFTVIPTGKRGRWVNGGRYPIVGSTVKVFLLDLAGVSRSPTRVSAQISLTCGGG